MLIESLPKPTFEQQQNMISDEEIIKNFNFHLKTIQDVTEGAEITPALTIVALNEREDNKEKPFEHHIVLIPEIPPTHMQRAEMFQSLAVEMVMQKISPILAIFGCETWHCEYASEEEKNEAYQKYGNSLVNHPMAQEALSCSAMTLDGRHLFKMVSFARGPKNKIVFPKLEAVDVKDIYNPMVSEGKSPIHNNLLEAYFKGVALTSVLRMIGEGRANLSDEQLHTLLSQMPSRFTEILSQKMGA